MDDKVMQRPVAQNLILENREKLNISGVTEVGSFNEDFVSMKTQLGGLTVYGSGLRINKLNLDNSEVSIEGSVQCLEYSDKNKGKSTGGGVFSKLFK